jgi:hypothetical protein
MHRLFNDPRPAWKEKLKDFPWAEEMAGAAHVGWIGGALNPSRTDWSQLEALGVKKIYVVADNDQPGLDALPEIARNVSIPTFAVKFTELWPGSFDLADPWPDTMFADVDGARVYIGPSFYDTLLNITWATNAVPPTKGTKPLLSIRDVFKSQWTYVQSAEIFVCNAFPHIRLSEVQFNKHMSAYSHTADLARLVHASGSFTVGELVYKPDAKQFRTTVNGSVVNTHMPSQIKPVKGNAKVFLDFMEHLFPNPDECREMMRWCATLIARPDVRMSYGVLLVSEKQGMGKTTLGSHILAPLVGHTNVSWPSEIDIVQSQFNDWIAEKRLIIVNEIYSGHSWKAYNNLKSYVTDKDLRVNVKYQKPYVIENWAHFFACSNSLRALKMDENDRRWFYPTITTTKWPKAKFDELYAWLKAGGLRVVKHWAMKYGDYVSQSAPAPMSVAKSDLIFESYTNAQREAAALGRALGERKEPTAVSTGAVEKWLKGIIGRDELGSSGHELRKAMKNNNVTQLPERFFINGRSQYIIVNDAFMALEGPVNGEKVQSHLANPELVLNSEL